jgi:hypothetical protein
LANGVRSCVATKAAAWPDIHIVIDGRNLYDPEVMAEHGITYYSVGRLPAIPHAEVGKISSVPENRKTA